MTGWDVFSDAVKIGLPLLLGGAVTLLSVHLTRRHGERTERRKRIRETLEGFTRAVCRWDDALKDHYLFCRDQYFERTKLSVDWAERNLETLQRSQRYRADVEEFRSLLLVHMGFGFSEKLGDMYAAHNAVTRAFSEPGKSEEEIAALQSNGNDAYRALLQTIRAAYEIV